MTNFTNRKQYIDKLLSFKDKDLIKVVSGLRRSGKSTLLDIYREQLLKMGIGKRQIQFYNFELPENYLNKNWDDIYFDIKKKLQDGKRPHCRIAPALVVHCPCGLSVRPMENLPCLDVRSGCGIAGAFTLGNLVGRDNLCVVQAGLPDFVHGDREGNPGGHVGLDEKTGEFCVAGGPIQIPHSRVRDGELLYAPQAGEQETRQNKQGQEPDQ